MAIDVSQAAKAATVTAKGAARAGRQEQVAQQLGEQTSPMDVWSHTYDGISEGMGNFVDDPVGSVERTVDDIVRGTKVILDGDQMASASGEAVWDSMKHQAGDLGNQVDAIGKAEGALATTGAVFMMLTSVEQLISAPLAMIPFPAFPALRATDMDIGLPHAHMHPPNLIPPAPPVPLPSTGPVIPIPILSCANKTLINMMPAGRCGDMGLGIWCGGYFPLFEVFLGSSSVWIEGARAGRLGVDITKHCIFTSPRPSDPPAGPMFGTTVTGSFNVLIGGIPMPSLLSMAIGAMFKLAFKGIAKVAGAAKRASKAADDVLEEVVDAIDDKIDDAADTLEMPAVPAVADDAIDIPIKTITKELPEHLPPGGNAILQVGDLLDDGVIVIRGGDEAFERAVRNDLLNMASTPSGSQLLDEIAENHARTGKNVAIEPLDDADKVANGGSGPHQIPDSWDAVPNADGSPGNGANSAVRYEPGSPNQGMPDAQHSPSDVVLQHELAHANNSGKGVTASETLPDGSPKYPADRPGFPNAEELDAVAWENAYRADRGLPLRPDYEILP